MATGRAYWKGYLKLSLVTCPVAMTPAVTDSEKVRFHTLNRATGNRVQSHYVDAETAEPVDEDDEVKGYQSERAVMLEPRDRGIVLWTLRYGDEVRDPSSYFAKLDGKPNPKLMSLVTKLIEERTRPWGPEMVGDPVQQQLLQLIAARKKGKRGDRAPAARRPPCRSRSWRHGSLRMLLRRPDRQAPGSEAGRTRSSQSNRSGQTSRCRSCGYSPMRPTRSPHPRARHIDRPRRSFSGFMSPTASKL